MSKLTSRLFKASTITLAIAIVLISQVNVLAEKEDKKTVEDPHPSCQLVVVECKGEGKWY